ncbi:caspase family protein, partial [Bradyrhizobium sp. 62]|uniref:caspase family protein n=1 Tax=Bradyrhizobium sp. 62 TaxID=1043588 RepID=UPI001FFA4DD9
MGALGWFSLCFCVLLTCSSAQAERRVALVIGNSAYKSVARLSNPANDATLVGGMFKKAGFDTVDVRLDLSIVEMRKALREFGGRTREADVAVIYYAGHGIELDGNNYLIPTDAVLETDTDVYDEALQLDRLLVTVEPAKQLRLVILDACRDNPFAKTMKRTVA